MMLLDDGRARRRVHQLRPSGAPGPSTRVGGLTSSASVPAGHTVESALSPSAPPGSPPARPGRGSRRAARRLRQLDEALPTFLDGVARALRSGASLPQAIDEGYRRADPVVQSTLAEARRAIELGHGLGPSLVAWSHAFPSAPVRLAVAAITLGIEAGGTTAQAVDSVASRIRDRLLLRREIAASSAQVRASVAVLVGAPPLAALVLGGLDGRALRFLFLAPAGWVLLAVSLGLDTVGWLWMRKLVAKVS